MPDISHYFQKSYNKENDTPNKNIKKGKNNDFFSKLQKLRNDGKISSKDYNYVFKFVKSGSPINYMANISTILKKHSGMNDELKKSVTQYIKNEDDIGFVRNEILNNKNRDWSQSQIDCIKTVLKFLYSGNATVCDLFGFAGSGKTTVIVDIIFKLRSLKLIQNVALSAPTNKAVNVMKSKLNLLKNNDGTENDQIDFVTIHKLLQYENDFDMEGGRIFVKKKKSLLDRYNIIIVDECSMIPQSILQDIKMDIEYCVNSGVIPKIIFVGDPAQLSPVHETSSLVFDKEFFKSKYCSLLCDVVRNSNNNVVNMCNNVRKWVMGDLEKPSIGKFVCPNIKFYRKVDGIEKTKSKWFKKFLYLTDKNNVKYIDNSIIITWTNDATKTYNNEVRKQMFSTESKNTQLSRFEINDKLMFNDFYKMPEMGDTKDEFRFYTSEQIKIIKKEIITKKFSIMDYKKICKKQQLSEHTTLETKYIKCIDEINAGTTRTYKLWKLDICRMLDSGNEADDHVERTILVLHENDIETHKIEKNYSQHLLKNLWFDFKTNHSKNLENIITYIMKPLWKQWANIFIDPFAVVDYGNSITTHKCQGSTYFNSFIDLDDMLKNTNIDECKRCIYTALGRPSNELHILMPMKTN